MREDHFTNTPEDAGAYERTRSADDRDDRPTLAELQRDEADDWQGPECQMCNGTGVARMIPGDGVPVYVRCPACNGHGRDPS